MKKKINSTRSGRVRDRYRKKCQNLDKEMKRTRWVDSICTKLLKAEESLTPTILLKIIHEIWISKNMPEDWKTGLILKLLKKGDLSDCNNWRGITLSSVTSKVYSKIIQE